LKEELQKLSQGDGKTFIVVDGLDHIEREQKVSRSLVDILPPPDTIPDNIIFILGSRTIESLDSLPERISQNATIVTMQPLSLSQITGLLKSHALELSGGLTKLLLENTKGHPLFLRYTIEELLGSSPAAYNEIIAQKDFKGDIFSEYQVFWKKNRHEDNFIRLLGIMSRFRYSYIDISLLEKFDVTRHDAQKIRKLSEHYFYKTNGVWQFFHNSFKEFLISESAKGLLTDKFDTAIDQEYHYMIYCKINNIDNEYRWNTIYHLFKAGKFAEVLSQSSQAFFRSQWFAYREPQYILEDIRFYSIASYKETNHVALLDSFLSAYEIKHRLTNFVPSDNYEIFHDLNKVDVANSFIFNNVELLVDNFNALHYALSLYLKGYTELAFDIFKKSEPTYILDTSRQVSSQRYDRDNYESSDEIALVVKWAQVAIFYHPFSYIMGKVRNIAIVEEYQTGEDRDIIDEVAQALLSICIDLENWSKLREIMTELKKELPEEKLFGYHFDIVYYLSDSDPFYGESLLWLSDYNRE
ncbi:hypothetical protein VF10_38565, partial [Nostoc linckia z13]|uniref:hypothetical protein n=1 Tax=Nostoc linckia TaxID=92942 RepID=UPI000C038A33